jgi:LPPG:FO 2-phospho-L-lactate transferase
VRIVGLGGGIGAARLWRPLLGRVDPAEVTIVTNTGDDLWIHGLRVCPDLDTVLYALTGRQDPERGWGLRGETWRCMAALDDLGGRTWFNLGDADLATHLFRTGELRSGRALSEVTAALGAALGLRARLLPMTDDEVETHVLTEAGEFHYQEFYIPRGATDTVRSVCYRGAEESRPAPGVLAAIADAELVVLGPSNPLASLGPILAVPGIRAALSDSPATVVGVTPIVSGTPITDPGEARRAASRAALLAGVGLPHTATSAASLLCDVLDVFVLDTADAEQAEAVAATGVRVVVADTLPAGSGHSADLVDVVLQAGAVATGQGTEGDR